MRELAGREGVSPPAMTAYVDRLEAAGLVVASPLGERPAPGRAGADGRGLRVLRSARSRRTAWLAARLERLEPEELAAVDAALPALRRLLEEDA